MNELLRRLLSGGPVLLDGAWGTQLQERGLATGECPDAWNLSHPERVEAVARGYVDAGSRVILTNTFGANRIALARYGLDGQADAINRAGVEISRRAAAGRAAVFASLGPCGKVLMSGDVTEDEVEKAFTEQAAALAGAHADALVVETMSDLAEASIAVAAAHATGIPVVACMSFDSGQMKDRTMMGVTPEQAATELKDAGADVIGANCGQGIDAYVPICARLRAATDLPVWIKPNAGLPEVVDGVVSYRTGADEFAEYAEKLVEAGADFVGGCCGTTPSMIREVAHRIQNIKTRHPRRS